MVAILGLALVSATVVMTLSYQGANALTPAQQIDAAKKSLDAYPELKAAAAEEVYIKLIVNKAILLFGVDTWILII